MYTCELCNYSTDQLKLYKRHLGRKSHKIKVCENEYPPIDIDFLYRIYVEENYNDSVKLLEIHNKCGGGAYSDWSPLYVYLDGIEYKCRGLVDRKVLEGILYVLYGGNVSNYKSSRLICRDGNIEYSIRRDKEVSSIMEYIDGDEYGIKKDVEKYVGDRLGSLADFKKRYIYHWKEVGPKIECNVDGYVSNADILLANLKKAKYNEVVSLSKKKDRICDEIKEVELDIKSLMITMGDILEISRLHDEYNRDVSIYNKELRRYRNSTGSDQSIDSTISEDGRYLLELKRKIYRSRYIPDEYSMMKSRYNLLENLKIYIQTKERDVIVVDQHMKNESAIVQGKLVPEEWLNMGVYKESVLESVSNIVDTYKEYIGTQYNIEYNNWLLSRCMCGEGFQMVVVDQKEKLLEIPDNIMVVISDEIDMC